ncbi:hypothetical protein PTSG_11847 [Salpingoeca rosetta]|uniref:Ribonucleases P/MRP subunit Pop8-like domain-containing protein n=1 Tax=Salpingoeca rosetta (strain ATCC 50818 / BSB-021) TaxID=946362 RepID=F2U1F3_SALR5|nr:uncharacterized protein PTSG_11847 [Salpingoeca rosetta]EGD81455.1 hypothetical protein PTSG_11847 [Salpingoeca rosetta]|eukprot:XP_004996659.1 hypothetical protein PTSG_11847 [Salpingoeca rosetta]
MSSSNKVLKPAHRWLLLRVAWEGREDDLNPLSAHAALKQGLTTLHGQVGASTPFDVFHVEGALCYVRVPVNGQVKLQSAATAMSTFDASPITIETIKVSSTLLALTYQDDPSAVSVTVDLDAG